MRRHFRFASSKIFEFKSTRLFNLHRSVKNFKHFQINFLHFSFHTLDMTQWSRLTFSNQNYSSSIKMFWSLEPSTSAQVYLWTVLSLLKVLCVYSPLDGQHLAIWNFPHLLDFSHQREQATFPFRSVRREQN